MPITRHLIGLVIQNKFLEKETCPTFVIHIMHVTFQNQMYIHYLQVTGEGDEPMFVHVDGTVHAMHVQIEIEIEIEVFLFMLQITICIMYMYMYIFPHNCSTFIYLSHNAATRVNGRKVLPFSGYTLCNRKCDCFSRRQTFPALCFQQVSLHVLYMSTDSVTVNP